MSRGPSTITAHATRRLRGQWSLALAGVLVLLTGLAGSAGAECRVDVESVEVPAFTRCFLDVDAGYELRFAAPLIEIGVPSQVQSEAQTWVDNLRAGDRRAYIEEDVVLENYPGVLIEYLVVIVGERRIVQIGEELVELNEAEDLVLLAEQELESVYGVNPDPTVMASIGDVLPAFVPETAERLARAQEWADQLTDAGYTITPYPSAQNIEVSVAGEGVDLRLLQDDLGVVHGIWPQGDLAPAPSSGFALVVQAQDQNTIVEIQDLTLDQEDQFMTGGYWKLFDVGTFPPADVDPPFGGTPATYDPIDHIAVLDLSDSFFSATMEFDVDKMEVAGPDVWVFRQTYNVQNVTNATQNLLLYNLQWFRITGFGIRDEGWIEGDTLVQAASPGGPREIAVTSVALGQLPTERAVHPCIDPQDQGDANCQFFGFYPRIGSGEWIDLSVAGSDWSLENKAGPSDLESGFQWGSAQSGLALPPFESFAVVLETYIYRTPVPNVPWPKSQLPPHVATAFENYLPEPSSALLQGLTLLTLGVCARRRRARQH